MTLIAPLNIETQHDDVEILDDDIELIDAPTANSVVGDELYEPLLPFLALGVINLLAILVVAILLAF